MTTKSHKVDENGKLIIIIISRIHATDAVVMGIKANYTIIAIIQIHAQFINALHKGQAYILAIVEGQIIEISGKAQKRLLGCIHATLSKAKGTIGRQIERCCFTEQNLRCVGSVGCNNIGLISTITMLVRELAWHNLWRGYAGYFSES